jgi:soluble lytic murein transglycosylase
MSGRSRALAVALLFACARTEASPATGRDPPGPPPASRLDGSGPADGALRDGTPAPLLWPDLVREERWDAAWPILESLPDAEKARPEVRYVRARVALARDDAAAAVPLLDGLEGGLPLLAEDIGRTRAAAKLAAGPFDDAARWFSARSDPASQLDAARAFEKAGTTASARLAAERTVRSAHHTHAQEAEARALRVRLAGEAPGEDDLADARWLATSGADAAPIDGVALLAHVDPKHPLTADELMTRARTLADAGRTDDALHAIDLAAGASSADKVSHLERLRARGNVLFHARGRGGEAARTLTECAEAGGPHAAEDAFHAARALSRVDRDEEAVRGYEDVARRYPKSVYADDAAFFVPYLRMLHAEWQVCAGGFDAYLHAHPSGTHQRDARRDGGLCKLLGGDFKGARTAFERLRDDLITDPIANGRMTDLAALAALRDGDRDHAVALWTEVSRDHPLSWSALVARARLVEAAAPLPPAIDPPAPKLDATAPLRPPLPAPADLLHRIGLDADAESALHERESAITSGAAGRTIEKLCSVYGELARARRRYQIAQTIPSSFLATAPDTFTRWAWDCAYPTPYPGEVGVAEAGEKLPSGLVWAVMRQESGFDPDAVSPARAVGLMQLMPDTARPVADELGIRDDARLTSPPFAIGVGARVLRKLLDRFHGNVPLAVAAYNAGTDAVERWMSRGQGMQLDAFVERIPYDETRDYVARVMGNLARYGYLAGGEAGVPAVDLALR